MATTTLHRNQHCYDIAPKYNKRRSSFSHENIKGFFNVGEIQQQQQQQQQRNKNKTNVDTESEEDVFQFGLYGANNYYKNYSSNKNAYYKALNTARLRKASSVLHNIIVESAYENMADENCTASIREVNNTSFNPSTSSIGDDSSCSNEDRKDETYDNNNNNHKVTRHDKKVYRLRKHHSDYDIVYLQIEQGFNETTPCCETTTRNRRASLEHENEIEESLTIPTTILKRTISKSESNLLKPRLRSTSCSRVNRINKSSSHIDITSTQTYKDIYADSLRQYGFLLAKQLGASNHPPDQLRKMYQEGRKKAMERRGRATTSFIGTSNSQDNFSPQRRLSNQSNKSNSISDLRSDNKYTCSLTDISNVAMLEKHKKPSTTTVIRRKKGSKFPRETIKRLSAPQLETVQMNGIISCKNMNNGNKEFYGTDTLPLRRSPETSAASLSNQNLSNGIHSSPENSGTEQTVEDSGTEQTVGIESRRKLSDETIRRKNQARAKHEFRMSRLKSFDGVLTQASTWMKDVKAKSHDQNSLCNEVIEIELDHKQNLNNKETSKENVDSSTEEAGKIDQDSTTKM